jgi:hypothetical protein
MPVLEERQCSCHIVHRNNGRFPRISAMLLGYLVLALALFGLAAVIAEALVKNPDALLEVARDSERFARPAPVARKAAPSPANDAAPRLAA